MKIIAVSDIHTDIFDKKIIDDRIEKICKSHADILIVGGDIAQNPEDIKKGLQKFANFSGKKLAYLGNHEVKGVMKNIEETIATLTPLYTLNNFHLLDDTFYIHDRIGFVGSVGWFDFSLYKGKNNTDAKEKGLMSFYDHSKLTDTTPQEMTQNCINRIDEQLKKIEPVCDKIILGIHHIAFSEFLKYNASDRLDYLNLFMGSELFQKLYLHPKVALGFCGHTHRSGMIEYDSKKIYNISSDKKMPYHLIEID